MTDFPDRCTRSIKNTKPAVALVSAVLHVGQNQRSSVLPVLGEAGAENGVHALVELVHEGVQVLTRLHVVEGNLSGFVIQEDSHFGGVERQHEGEAGRRQGFHLAVLQPQAPVAPLGTQLDLALPACRAPGHAEGPGGLACHVHLPVVAPRAEALPSQDEECRAEALGPVGVGNLALLVFDLLTVL